MERDEPAIGPIEQFVVDDTDPLLNSAATRRDLRNLANRIDSQFVLLDARLGGQITELDARLGGQITELDARLGGQIMQLDARLGGQILQLGSDLRDKINTMGFALAGLIIASNLSMFAVFLSLR